ncbi:MAG: HSP20 family protein [Rhodothermales bacterium]|jgi:HSP20 family protein
MKDETIKPRKATDEHCFTPRVDIWEDSEALHMQLEMPGVGPDAVDVRLEEGVLNVLGRVPASVSGKRVLSEYEVGNFERAFRVSESIDGSKIEARMRNGVLNLTLPKAEAAKPKRIAVHAA